MDNEQQIIEDILDSLYGVNVALKDEDEKVVASRNQKRNEKRSELLIQINSICIAVAKELESTIDIKNIDIQKDIKPSVLIALKAQAENKNIILDSNGNINTGKFLDIVTQSKGEILDKIEGEKDTLNHISQESVEENRYKEEVNIDSFFQEMDDCGIDLTETDKETIRKAIARANAILKAVNEKVKSGMTEDEAWDQIFEGMSVEEIAELEMQFALADIAKEFGGKRGEKKTPETIESKDGGEVEEKTGEETSVGTNDSKTDNSKARSNYYKGIKRIQKKLINSKGQISSTNKMNPGSETRHVYDLMEKMSQNAGIQEYITTNQMLHSFASATFYPKESNEGAPTVSWLSTGDHLQNDTAVESYESKTQNVPVKRDKDEKVILGIKADHTLTQSNDAVGSISPTNQPIYASLTSAPEETTARIPEEKIEGYYMEKGVNMDVAPIDFSEQIAIASRQQMGENVSPISGAVEMIVDETAASQNTQPAVQSTWGVGDIKSIIAATARAREMFEASGTLQGITRAEIPVEERNGSQGTQGVNDTEVGGEEIE